MLEGNHPEFTIRLADEKTFSGEFALSKGETFSAVS
jgi:hypothetical protein